MIEITEAVDPAAIAAARTLFEQYQKALDIDLSFQGFATELGTLPGDYASPRGQLLLARDGDALAGCVAMRPLTHDTCEMKRLYVTPRFRATGVGRLLTERVIAEARAAGYTRMCLDTLPSMASAQRLYESLGFRDIPAYRDNPIAGARFLGLDLGSG